MCGIAGILRREGRSPMDRPLAAMVNSMAHRGPDGAGLWTDPAGTCGLAHRRLAIIDPETGQQPMANEDETIWVIFNGCIYNYQDLARELRGDGHRFRSHSDTEVILHAYEQWGTDCVSRFNGMWAFALWDARKELLFCSRDRVGIKPFYYAWDGRTLVFASEPKALLASGLHRAEVCPDGLRQYLTFQFCLGETTLFRGIKKLVPGHNLIARPGGEPRIERFWELAFDLEQEHTDEWFVDKLAWLLEDAVRLRLRSDVPLGAHLSGGLDSLTIVCLARGLLGQTPIKTFTGAYRGGEAFDETRYVRAVARSAQTDLMELYIGPGDFLSSIEKIIWHMDEPAAGPGIVGQFWVSRLASDHVKVVLGGQGGDEIFIGYARYLLAYLEECLKGAIEDTAHRANYVATLETIVPSLPTLENYVPMLKLFWREGLFDDPAHRYFRLMDRFADGRRLLCPRRAAEMDTDRTFEEFRALFQENQAAAMINRILCFDLKAHVQSLLHVEDRTSMAWGLESRVPLLDHRLIEHMASVPPTIKFRNGRLKALFHRAVENIVPAEILDRKDKMGFPIPLNDWLRTDLRDFVGDLLGSRRARERGLIDPDAVTAALSASEPFSRSLWGALCLEIWHRQFIDETPPVEIDTTPAARAARTTTPLAGS